MRYSSHHGKGIQMKKNIAMVLVIFASLAFSTIAVAEMKEGLWEIKTEMDMPGMPAKIPPTTMQTCISKDDLVPKPAAPKGQEQECRIKEQNISGDTVTYSMECKGQGGMTMEITGKMTYAGDTMEGTSTMNMSGPMSMEMTTKMTGKYMGPCTK